MQNAKLVYKILTFIPKGKVTTYGQLSRLLGIKSPRVMGNILHKNPNAPQVPCHRVITRDGRMGTNYSLGGSKAQEKRLKAEGVEIVGGKVDLGKHLWRPSKSLKLYLLLLSRYGEPGPWPWFGTGPAHTTEEIAIGTILTQNTNWKNVQKALDNLRKKEACAMKGIYELGIRNYEGLLELIRPSGYYNQKTKRLFEFCKFIVEKHKTFKNFLARKGAREELLALYGIGPETCDTILLYAGNRPVFVIDAYTKKFATHYKLIEAPRAKSPRILRPGFGGAEIRAPSLKAMAACDRSENTSLHPWANSPRVSRRRTKHLSYDDLQKLFLKNLPEDAKLFQDYHALIVKWGKNNTVQDRYPLKCTQCL